MEIALARRLTLAITVLSLAAFVVALPAIAPPTAVAQSAGQQFDDEEPGDDELGDDLGDDEGFDDEEWLDEEELVADDVLALEQATGELGRAKRNAAGKVARLARSASVLRPCLRGGPGWKRIRAVKHAPQRGLYAASARRLLADMKLLLDGQQPRILAYESAFERFVADVRGAGVADPTLREAVAAQGRRLAAYRDIRAVKADCSIFNKLTKRVREFPTRSAAQIVRADYRAAPLARKIERHISNQLTRIDRRHGISYRDAETLEQAADVMVELGGEAGYATGFQYALSLR